MTSQPPPADSDDTTRQLIVDLWQRLLPQTVERLQVLDRAAKAAAAQTLIPDLQAEAIAIAHKFAGSLGMFGFHEGTRLARELEQHLNSPDPDAAALANLTTQLRRSLPGLHLPTSTNPAEETS